MFLIFRPDVFLDGGMDRFKARMEDFAKEVGKSKKMQGFDVIYTRGEMEAELDAG